MINFFYIQIKNIDFNTTPIYNLFKNDKFYVEISTNSNNNQTSIENTLTSNYNSQNNPLTNEKDTNKSMKIVWKLII